MKDNRRTFLKEAGLLAVGALSSSVLISCASPSDPRPVSNTTGAMPVAGCGMTPAEELMREHGLVERGLLVYEECSLRLMNGQDVPLGALETTTRMMRDLGGKHHTVMEEEYLFPRLRKAGQLVPVVDELVRQHNAARQMAADILTLLDSRDVLSDKVSRRSLATMLQQYVRMYRPHAAMEDTLVFPAFARLVPEAEYRSLTARFQDHEARLFGDHGFQELTEQATDVEKQLGLSDLSMFTPTPPSH